MTNPMNQRKPSIGFIFVTLLLDILGLGLIIPVLPELVKSFTGGDFGQASTTLGVMTAIFALMQFVFAPILGSLSDQFGRRPVILISLFGSALDYLLLAFAPSLSWFFLGRIIAGITSANITAATAYIADVSPPEKRAQNFGLIGAAFGLGFILGPAIGGLLGGFGLRVPFFVVAGITLLNWLYGYFVVPESLAPENRRPFNWKRANPIGSLWNLTKYPIVLGLAGTILLTGLAQNALQSTWVLYTEYRFAWDTQAVGLSLAVVGVSAMIVQGGFIRTIIPKLGERRSLIFGLIVSTIAFILYGLASKGWMMYAIPFFGAFGALAQPSAQGIISQSVGANEQGSIQGALASLNSLTGVIGPLIATNVFSYFISDRAPIHIPGAAFFAGSILIFFAILLTLNTFRRLPATSPMAEAAPIASPLH